jgi:hypothetical protein
MNSIKANSKHSSENIYHYMKNNIDNHNINKDIIKGYNGIMDLDLTYVPEELKKTMIDQHYKDIDNYKNEQNVLEPRLRYENTIERVQKSLEKTEALILKRLKAQEAKQLQYNKEYNKSRLK